VNVSYNPGDLQKKNLLKKQQKYMENYMNTRNR